MCLAIPGKIESIDGADPMFRTGKVSFGGIFKTINLACVPKAQTGDYVLVHAGIAINIIDEEEARKTLDCWEEIGGMELPETLP
jgi:hydrogenase expression/formation protein HypC